MAKIEIDYDGKTFDSIADFVREYGLKYPTTSVHLRQGLSPGESIRRQQVAQRNVEDGKCEYDGQKFSSLFEAAESLGFSPTYLYGIRNKKGCSANEAIKQAMEGRTGNNQGNHSPVEIDGVIYPNKISALRAYDIPYVTATTRMRRENISFQEAVLRGNKFRKRMFPTFTLFNKSKLKAAKGILENEDSKLAQDILDGLRVYPIKVSFFKINDSTVLHFEDTIPVMKHKYNVWIVVGKYQIEIVVTDLVSETFIKNQDLSVINDWNAKFSTVKVWQPDPKSPELYIGNNIPRTTRKDADTSVTLSNLFAVLGVCEEIAKAS